MLLSMKGYFYLNKYLNLLSSDCSSHILDLYSTLPQMKCGIVVCSKEIGKTNLVKNRIVSIEICFRRSKGVNHWLK